MDFSTMFGLVSPQGGDPFALGSLLSNPDEAAKAFASAGLQPPTEGQGLMDWVKGFLPQLPQQGAAPFANLGFPGTPAVDPNAVPGAPPGLNPNAFPQMANLGALGSSIMSGYNKATQPYGPEFGEAFGSRPAGVGPTFNEAFGSVPGSPTQKRTTGVPGTAGPPMNIDPNAGVTTGPTLEQAGKAKQEYPGGFNPEGVKRLQDALSGLKKPESPEAAIPRAPAAQLPGTSAMPRDIVQALVQALMKGGGGGGGLRLGQALGGLRG